VSTTRGGNPFGAASRPRSPRRRPAILAAVALTLVTLSAWWAAGDALTRAARAELGAPPADLGAETVRIQAAAGPTVVGWLARGVPGTGAVLLLHPVRANRAAMLSRARFLHRDGYTVLLIDLPAHGESPGERITFGARESDGARAALGYLRRAAPGDRIGALGSSLGGASLLLGTGDPTANDADAVVLEAVYPTIREAVADRLRIRLGALGPPLAPLLTVQLRPRLGIGAEALRPLNRIRAVRTPLLIIAGEADRHTTLAESQRLFAAAREPKELWVVSGAAHVDLHAYAGGEYERRVLAFFQQHLRSR